MEMPILRLCKPTGAKHFCIWIHNREAADPRQGRDLNAAQRSGGGPAGRAGLVAVPQPSESDGGKKGLPPSEGKQCQPRIILKMSFKTRT